MKPTFKHIPKQSPPTNVASVLKLQIFIGMVEKDNPIAVHIEHSELACSYGVVVIIRVGTLYTSTANYCLLLSNVIE